MSSRVNKQYTIEYRQTSRVFSDVFILLSTLTTVIAKWYDSLQIIHFRSIYMVAKHFGSQCFEQM